MILVTGGAGFIGSNFILNWLAENDEQVLNVDKLTYAGNLQNLHCLHDDPRYIFARVDICDTAGIETLLSLHRPRAVLNFAAESHVDRSIASPDQFVRTNVTGTFSLLEAVRGYWSALRGEEGADFRFLQISTDEVYGSLGPRDAPFTESSPYAPNSPYAATKASADHLVRAYHHTYGLPTLTTNCSNNYGPYHFPEKLIPLMITNALGDQPLPVYGDGLQVRDWLYVTDHCMALSQVLHAGDVGEVYNVGGRNEKTNLDVVHAICTLLDELAPRKDGKSYGEQITLVKDRPGHDRRYAIDAGKIERELGFTPLESFESGLRKTVEWYLENPEWVRNVKSGDYRRWVGGRA